MSYRPKPDVRAEIVRALEAGHRRLCKIYDFVMRARYYDPRFSGWSWVDLELRRMKHDGLVYYAQRSPGVRPGWYLFPQTHRYGAEANITARALEQHP